MAEGGKGWTSHDSGKAVSRAMSDENLEYSESVPWYYFDIYPGGRQSESKFDEEISQKLEDAYIKRLDKVSFMDKGVKKTANFEEMTLYREGNALPAAHIIREGNITIAPASMQKESVEVRNETCARVHLPVPFKKDADKNKLTEMEGKDMRLTKTRDITIPALWTEFKLKFEYQGRTCFRSGAYDVEDVLPAQMQFIAESDEEKSILFQALNEIGFEGQLQECIIICKPLTQEVYEKVVNDKHYSKEQVKMILLTHIQKSPKIEKKNVKILVGDFIQSKELKDLPCIKTNMVKLYKCNAGKVYFVGRGLQHNIDTIMDVIRREKGERNSDKKQVIPSLGIHKNNEQANILPTFDTTKEVKNREIKESPSPLITSGSPHQHIFVEEKLDSSYVFGEQNTESSNIQSENLNVPSKSSPKIEVKLDQSLLLMDLLQTYNVKNLIEQRVPGVTVKLENDGLIFTGKSSEKVEMAEEELKELKKTTKGKMLKKLHPSEVQMLMDLNYSVTLSHFLPGTAVHFESNEIIFFGCLQDLERVEDHLEQFLQTSRCRHVKLTKSHIETAKKLDFVSLMKVKCPHVEIELKDASIIITGQEENVLEADKEINNYFSLIKNDSIPMQDAVIAYLRLETVNSYVLKHFEKKNIKCCWQIDEENKAVQFHFLHKDECIIAEAALKECFSLFELSAEDDIQKFEECSSFKQLCHENKDMFIRYSPCPDGVSYVGLPHIMLQLQDLYTIYKDEHTSDNRSQPDSASYTISLTAPDSASYTISLTAPVLAFFRKYLMVDVHKKFAVKLLELRDIVGIQVTGSQESVQNAVTEVKELLKEMYIDIFCMTNMFNINRQVKEIATIEKENKTIIDIIFLPEKGKEIMTVPIGEVLEVCLVYGSTATGEVGMQLVPVNQCSLPQCVAAVDIIEKGSTDLQKCASYAFGKYIDKEEKKKPEMFQFICPDSAVSGDNSQWIVYFVMPDMDCNVENLDLKFREGLSSILDYASKKGVISMSLPVEMHEKLPVTQIANSIVHCFQEYLARVPKTTIKKVYLCSVEKCNQVFLMQVLESATPSDCVMEVGYFDINAEEDAHENIAVVAGTLLDQQVDIIVNSTTKELSLDVGHLSNTILAAAGSSIQKECKDNYPEGIKFGEVAVTSGGSLQFKRIFHGALCKSKKDDSHRLNLRCFMKNCLQKVRKVNCDSIAFPALGIGRLQLPVEVVAKEMFWAVSTYAKRFGVKHVKFVIPEEDVNTYRVFKNMETTMKMFLQESPGCWPKYEVSLEGGRPWITITALKKHTQCDVDILLCNPKDTFTENICLKYPDESKQERKTTIIVNREPKNWNERLYLDVNNLSSFKEGLNHAVLYVKYMKFTSLSLHIEPVKHNMTPQSAIVEVIYFLAAKMTNLDSLEKVMIVVSDETFHSLTPWFDENVKASHGNKSWTEKFFSLFSSGQQVKVLWRKLQGPCLETYRNYFRIIGPDITAVRTSYKTLQRKINKLAAKEKTKDVLQDDADHAEDAADHERLKRRYVHSDMNGAENGMSTQDSENACVHGVPPHTDLPKGDEKATELFVDFMTEVAPAVLNIIKTTQGDEGVNALISELEDIAERVDTSNGKVTVYCDFKNALKVQECVFSHYEGAKRDKKNAQDIVMKHVIKEGNVEIMELLQFAYGHKDWSKQLKIEKGNLCLLGTLSLKEEVETAVKTVFHWCQDEFVLSPDEKHKAEEALNLVRLEFPNIFIKQISDRVIMKVDNADTFEKAKHKVKVALGRVKITSRGRRARNLKAGGEASLSMPQEDNMEASPMSLAASFKSSQQTAVLAMKTYYTKEGIIVKVYIGDIVKLPVDSIVNAANEMMSHGGGVALAISKAAGRDFDQEGEAYVRTRGPIQVTQCCVTSAGRLPYKNVIHVVGPQWHDYKHNEKNRCGEDLRKTIVNCLVEADRLLLKSIAIPSISSGIFGVPKPLCAQMYAEGVVEFSKTCSFRFIKEIHFVDMVSEMCQLTQLAFDAELNNSARNIPETSGDTIGSDMDSLSADQKQSQGNIENLYVFKPCDHLSILIYSHDITDTSVDAIICPVSPYREGGIVKSVKQTCGSLYTDDIYTSVMTCIKNENDVVLRSHGKQSLRFKHILHIYSPQWVRAEDDKEFENRIRKSMRKIFQATRTYGLKSVAIPVLGIGDQSTPFNKLCAYMIDEIVNICANLDLLPTALTAIHLVTNDIMLALHMKEIASQKFGPTRDLTGKGNQSWKRSVKHSGFSTLDLQITTRNDNHKITQGDSHITSHHDSVRGHEGQNETCPICMDTLVDPVAFNKCRHVLCKECMELTMKNKPVCPVCGKAYGIITGSQPDGFMNVKTTSSNLPGFKNYGTIEIFYTFPDGIQKEEHPNPGQPYQGTKRHAYLPDNREGRKVLSLLQKAFDRRLVFTIGRSVTTGAENTVTWNDIHHKTHRDGGPQNYGYPDPDYLRRVQEELAAKGVTEDA